MIGQSLARVDGESFKGIDGGVDFSEEEHNLFLRQGRKEGVG